MKIPTFSLGKSLLTFSFFLVSLGLSAQSGGSGTVEDPYIIANEGDLQSICTFASVDASDGVCFSITADIALTEPWTDYVIGQSRSHAFRGKITGNGHKITGLSIVTDAPESGNTDYYGLFGTVGSGAAITDLTVSGSITINPGEGSAQTGGIAAYIVDAGETGGGEPVLIKNCSSNVTISNNAATPSYAGGIVGRIVASAMVPEVTIEACHNSGDVSATGLYIGGIVGYGNGQFVITVTDCYNTGNISASGTEDIYTGAIVGYMYQSSATSACVYTIKNCYATGSVTGPYTAALIGRIANSASATIKGNVALMSNISGGTRAYPILGGGNVPSSVSAADNFSSNALTASGTNAERTGTPIDPAVAKTAAFYSTNLPQWDFANVWKLDEGVSYPYFKWQTSGVNAIKGVDLKGNPVATYYYNLQGVKVTAPTQNGIYIVKTVYDNGQTVTSKEMTIKK
jgi:hypothetical protein